MYVSTALLLVIHQEMKDSNHANVLQCYCPTPRLTTLVLLILYCKSKVMVVLNQAASLALPFNVYVCLEMRAWRCGCGVGVEM